VAFFNLRHRKKNVIDAMMVLKQEYVSLFVALSNVVVFKNERNAIVYIQKN